MLESTQSVQGQTISHYRILEKLGEGGMGVVYKAEDTKLNRIVALKFLVDRALQVEELNKRFLREAQAAARLDHPNICTMYGLEEAEDRRFLVMAFLEGETLFDRLRVSPPSLRESLEIAIQAAQGLQEAHERGIVHRDIKPPNIFITKKGLVKITDFGLAFLADRSRITKAGSTLGTVNYMSPEQFMAEVVDRRSDIWALGVVLYEMICGCLPFQGTDMQSAMRLILNSQPRPPGKARKGCPAELERILTKALAKDREERYQHIDDLIVDLRIVRDVLPAEPAAPSGVRVPVEARSRPDAPTETVELETGLLPPRPSSAEKRTGGPALLIFGVIVLAGILLAWWRFLQ
jgi:serine/threonine protein kinase